MWSQNTRLVREGALGPLSFVMKDSIQSNQQTINQNSFQSIRLSYNTLSFFVSTNKDDKNRNLLSGFL